MNARALLPVMLLSMSAAAAETVVASTTDTPAAERIDRPRFRLGAGAFATIGGYPFRSGGVTGTALQLGVQLDDHWAVFALGQACVWPYLVTGSLSLLTEYTFGGIFSIGAGPMLGGTRLDIPLLLEESSTVLAGHLRLAVQFGPQPVGIWRNRFYVAFDGWAGAQVKGYTDRAGSAITTPIPMGGGISIGYQLM